MDKCPKCGSNTSSSTQDNKDGSKTTFVFCTADGKGKKANNCTWEIKIEGHEQES